MRIAAIIEYDGTDFHGWQAQQGGIRTVQGELELALSKVADSPIEVVCAGRTDAGVHATGQVVHFDTPVQREMRSWILGANSNLPNDVSVRWANNVADDFHARFQATARSYCYVILQSKVRSAVLRNLATWDCRPLDADKMQQAANYWLGEHDFTSFRAASCQAHSPVRNVTSIDIKRQGDVITVKLSANAFLHHMVRNFVGTLASIGCGDQPVAWAKEVLEAKNRCAAGITAPSSGLYLTAVAYADKYNIPVSQRVPAFDWAEQPAFIK